MSAARVADFAKLLLAAWNAYRRDTAKKGKPPPRDASSLIVGARAQPQDTQTIDPFILRIDAEIGSSPSTQTKKLRLYYQFDKSYYGYVVGITEVDGATKTKGAMTEELTPQQPGRYSSKHEEAGTTLLTDLVNQPNGPIAFDAMTNLAGEAARWQCVRRAASEGRLRDNFVFYTKLLPDGYVGIKFVNLWKRWKEFENAFDIPDTDVISKLRAWSVENHNWLIKCDRPLEEPRMLLPSS